ncbi:MAG: hypothetical protein ACLUIS_00460 [Longibaculum sp.]
MLSKGIQLFWCSSLDAIKNADWIVDLGPEGGDKGGKVNVQGTVTDVQQCSQSYWSTFKARHIDGKY